MNNLTFFFKFIGWMIVNLKYYFHISPLSIVFCSNILADLSFWMTASVINCNIVSFLPQYVWDTTKLFQILLKWNNFRNNEKIGWNLFPFLSYVDYSIGTFTNILNWFVRRRICVTCESFSNSNFKNSTKSKKKN